MNKEEYARLKKLAKLVGKKLKEVLDVYYEVRKTTTSDRLAVNLVSNKYRKELRKKDYKPKAKAKVITGFVWGEIGLIDKAANMRSRANTFIKKEGNQAAIDAQKINGDGVPLDQRQKIFGRENPNYLEPLNPKLKLLSRTLFGLFKLNGDSKFKFTSIHTEDNKLAGGWRKVKRFIPCTTWGIIKENTSEMRVNSSSAEGTTTIFKRVDEQWDIYDVIKSTIGDQMTDITSVPEHYKAYKDAWDRKIFLQGMIGWLNLERTDYFGRRSGLLVDPLNPDVSVRIEIPAHIDITWGEGSEVIVLGKTRQSMYRDPDTNKLEPGDVVVTVFGIFPIPGMTTEVASTPEVTSDEEIDGWLD